MRTTSLSPLVPTGVAQDRVRDRDAWCFDQRSAIVATKHHKRGQIAPVMEALLGLRVVAHVVDTDQFGTFSGEVARILSPLDCAIAKARVAMNETQSDLCFASEGTIGSHPHNPWVTTDRELIVLVDDRLGHVFAETAESTAVVSFSATVDQTADVADLARRADLPTHAVIVHAQGSPNVDHGDVGRIVFKGIRTTDELARAIESSCAHSPRGTAHVMTDYRAHLCPSRQVVITAAAERLARRLRSQCGECGAPGFGVVRNIAGIPCTQCGFIVPAVRAEIHRCWACAHEVTHAIPDAHGDPRMCDRCNP